MKWLAPITVLAVVLLALTDLSSGLVIAGFLAVFGAAIFGLERLIGGGKKDRSKLE